LAAVLIANFLHTMGRGYAAITLVSYFLILGRPRGLADWALLLAGTGAITLYTIVSFLVDHPEMGVPFVVSGSLVTNPLDVIRDNILEAPRIMGRTVEMAGGLIPALLIAALAVMRIEAHRRRALIVFLVVLGGLCLFSLFHIWPRIPAELFARIWIGLAVLITGCIAFVFVHVARAAYTSMVDLYRSGTSVVSERTLFTPAAWIACLLAGITIMLTAFFSFHMAQGIYAHYRAQIMITGRHDYSFDQNQVKKIFAADGSCGTILYRREEPMHAYFLFGAMQCGAIFEPAARFDENFPQRVRVSGPDRVTHVVSFSPMAQWQGAQPVSPQHSIDISFDDRAAGQSIAVRIEATDGATLLLTQPDGDPIEVPVAPGFAGWVEIPGLAAMPGTRVTLQTRTGMARFEGIRLGQNRSLNWPWGQGVTLDFVRDVPFQFSKAMTIDFSIEELFPTDMSVEVIGDDGMSVLGAVSEIEALPR